MFGCQKKTKRCLFLTIMNVCKQKREKEMEREIEIVHI